MTYIPESIWCRRKMHYKDALMWYIKLLRKSAEKKGDRFYPFQKAYGAEEKMHGETKRQNVYGYCRDTVLDNETALVIKSE